MGWSVSGAIDAYTLTTTTGSTTDAFGDPVTYNTLSGITHQSTIDTAVTATAYPIVGSDGDLTGDGIPDLWATTSTGALQVWPGIATSSSAPLTGLQATPPARRIHHCRARRMASGTDH